MSMKNEALALDLASADSEKQIVKILTKARYWDDDSVWCDYGDTPMNYSIIGNQQGSADSALVEKLVNSVDAVLMKRCLKRGVDPSSKCAPRSIAQAQKEFFDIHNGKLSSIDSKQRSTLAENILLVATGNRKKPSLTIVDKGEGQSPKQMPETILSLTRNNKIKIGFVQGKFGMGGSGVLRFCSTKHQLLLIISKRDADICEPGETMWGVTVVRREDPKHDEKSSRYTYLAPENEILSFAKDTLPLLPSEHPEPLGQPLASGTYIKLYEYDIGARLRTFIGFDLYYRLSLLMPDIALPIRMMERRKGFTAHSADKTLAGLSVRLDEDRSENLEPDFQLPGTGEMTVDGEKLRYSIYVFKKGKSKNYAGKDGIIFSINGQAHGFLSRTFFDRKAVGMSYLKDSILVTIDCSHVKRGKQESLFMTSRDRLANTDIRKRIERELEIVIKNHEGLKQLQNRRREEAISGKLQDAKPLTDVLEDIIKKSPSLSQLFTEGTRISSPFNTKKVGTKEEFSGKQFPTFFNPVKKYAKKKPKPCQLKRKLRVQYETDAENNYFGRDNEPGEMAVRLCGVLMQDYSLNLWNGRANLNLNLPTNVTVGDLLCVEIEVSDSRVLPFTDKFYIRVEKTGSTNGGGGNRVNPPDDDKPGNSRQKKSQLDLPNLIEITKDEWNSDDYKDFGFNNLSALKVRGVDNSYDFFINMDNYFLLTEIKGNGKTDASILKARYKFGMVLLGISLIDYEKKHTDEQDEEAVPVDEKISHLTEAISPTLLPMIASLGDSELDA